MNVCLFDLFVRVYKPKIHTGVTNMPISDKLRKTQIKANIISDDNIGLFDIGVEVENGVAILSGEVENQQQKDIAETLAYEVEGIIDVENNIVVVPRTIDEVNECEGVDAHIGYALAEGDVGDTAFAIAGEVSGPGSWVPSSEQFPGEYTDEEVDYEVRELLAKQQEIDTSRLRFSVDNQVVDINGRVKNPDELNNLLDMILKIRGVMGIRTDVKVDEGEIGTPTD